MAILREAGIPVESLRGPYGGYRLGRGLRVPPLMFSQTEALGLVMAVLDGHHAAADADDPVGSALGKIVRVLPAPVAAQAEAVRRTAAPLPDRGAARPDPGTTTTLVGAVADRRRVGLDYRTEAGRRTPSRSTHGRSWCGTAAGTCCAGRTPRRRRGLPGRPDPAVTPLDARFEPPADLDPVADLEHHLGLAGSTPPTSSWMPHSRP